MPDDPKEVVLAAFDRLNDHDLDGYYALCDTDFAYNGPTPWRGHAEARAIDEPLFEAMPDHWRRVDRILVSGDTVAVWLTFGGTPTATNRPFEVEVCDIFEVRNGVIQSLTMYADWPALMGNFAP